MPARWRVKPVASGAATPPVTDITLSASTIADNATAGTAVGTLSNNLGVSVSWSITDNTKFQLSASTGVTVELQRSSTGTLTAGVGETVTIQATRSGTAPYEEPFSITVSAGGETFLGYLTITNGTAGAGTSVPFQLMWPTAPAEITVGRTLNVYDDNGSGSQGTRLANFQVDNLSTDMNGDERLYLLSGIVPSLGSSATRKMWVYSSSTAVPSGTSITEADLFATSWRNVVNFDIGGTTYSVDTDDLNGASTTWSKTAPVRHDDWMDGPAKRCFVYSSPPFNGATPHASGDGLRVWFHIYVTKATTAAVSGGNPILSVECDIVLRNMDTQRVAPANYWYGLQVQRSTSLSDGTLITSDYTDFDGNVTRYSYPRSAPAATLSAVGSTGTYRNSAGADANDTGTFVSSTSATVAGDVTTTYVADRRVRVTGTSTGTIYGVVASSSYSAPNTTINFTFDSGTMANEALGLRVAGTGTSMDYDLSTGSWASDILGAHINVSSVYAYIISRVSASRIRLYFVGTAYPKWSPKTSGNWSIEGVGHLYGGTWTTTTHVGVQPIAAVVWGDNTSAVTPTTVAGRNLVQSKSAINNYGFLFSNITLNMTNLNAMRADNAIRPFTQLGPTGVYMGDIDTYIDGTGNRADIGIMHEDVLLGLSKPTGDGRRKMKENSLYFHTAQYNGTRRYSGSPSAGSLGVVPQQNNGTQYSYDSRWGTLIAQPATTWTAWSYDVSHAPEVHYAGYLYTGKLIYLERIQETSLYSWMCALDPGGHGSGLNQTPIGDADNGSVDWGYTQQRQSAWTLRNQVLATFCTPDASKPTIYPAKSVYETTIENTWSRAAYMQTTTTNGSGSDDWYDTDGSRYVGYRFNGNVDYAPWQTRYWDWAILTANELGTVSADTQSFLEWMSVGYVGISQSPDVAPDYFSTNYYVGRVSVNGAQSQVALIQSWAAQYQASALWPHGYEASVSMRVPDGITLSAVSGSSITVTLSGGPLGATSWYAGSGATIQGGWITEGGYSGGKGQITAVANSNSCTISTLTTGGATFNSTTPTASSCRIPMPHPNDAGAAGSVGGDSTYMQLYRLAGEMYADIGVSTAACVTYITSRTGFPGTLSNKLNIDSR